MITIRENLPLMNILLMKMFCLQRVKSFLTVGPAEVLSLVGAGPSNHFNSTVSRTLYQKSRRLFSCSFPNPDRAFMLF